MKRLSRTFWLLSSATIALAASLAVTPAPAGAASTIQVVADLGGCIFGNRPVFASLDVTWTDAQGQVKASFSTTASEYGWYAPRGVCNHHAIQIGDTIHIHETSPDDVTHDFTVPRFSGAFSRSTGIVAGNVPTHGTFAVVIGRPNLSLGSIPKTCILSPTADSTGHFRVDTTGCVTGYAAIGGDAAVLEWGNGNDGVRDFIHAPYLEELLGTPKIDGYLGAGTTAPLVLRTSAGALRGTATAVADPVTGAFKANFHANGHPVMPHVGNVIHGTWAGPQGLTLRQLSIDTTSVPNAIAAKCTPNTPFGLSLATNGRIAFAEDGMTDGTGQATPLDLATHVLTSGDVIAFTCMRPNGDRTKLAQTVP